MKTKILMILKAADSYVSGQELCRQLGVSRTAVWKVMNQLREEGYLIDSVQNKGYRLKETPDVLSESELKSRLQTEWAGGKIYYFEETGSTNTDAKHFMEEGDPHGTLVVAEYQNSGKGRRGRNWVSDKGSMIAATIGLRPKFFPDQASMLTLLMALAVCRGIRNITNLPAMIKWPNDIVVNRKKVCGILTEMSAETDFIHYVVIGFGINSRKTEFPKELEQTATSLQQESGKMVNRAELLAEILKNFEEIYTIFEKKLDLSTIMGEYNDLLVNYYAEVVVLDIKGSYEGIAQGINDRGELLVAKRNGDVVAVFAGEVSVRGIYGYV